MMAPSMCDQRAGNRGVLHHLMVAEVLAIRLECQLQLVHLAAERKEPSLMDWSLAVAVELRYGLREAIGKARVAAGGEEEDTDHIAVEAVRSACHPENLVDDVACRGETGDHA